MREFPTRRSSRPSRGFSFVTVSSFSVITALCRCTPGSAIRTGTPLTIQIPVLGTHSTTAKLVSSYGYGYFAAQRSRRSGLAVQCRAQRPRDSRRLLSSEGPGAGQGDREDTGCGQPEWTKISSAGVPRGGFGECRNFHRSVRVLPHPQTRRTFRLLLRSPPTTRQFLGPYVEPGRAAHKAFRHAVGSAFAARQLAGLESNRGNTADSAASAQLAADTYRNLPGDERRP